MLILIYGEDTYSSSRYLKQLLAKFLEKHGFDGAVHFFDADEGEWTELAGRLSGSGLFSAKQLVVAKNVFTNKEVRESLADLLDTRGLPEDTTLILHEQGGVDKRTALAKRLLAEPYTREFPAPDPAAMAGCIRKFAKEMEINIEPEAVTQLACAVGADTWRASSELAKLSHLAGGKIAAADVKAYTWQASEEDIWRFIDALSSSNRKTVFDLLDAELASYESPQQFLGMIVRQIRLLLALHEAQGPDAALASSLKLHPFVVKKTRDQAKRFTSRQLHRFYMALVRLDRALKEGKGKPEILFTVLVDALIRK